MNEDFANNPMLGTYTVEDGVPVDPQIVLADCRDTTMLGQLVTVFGGNPDIRFFLVPEQGAGEIDPARDLYFVSHDGNWVLSQDGVMTEVLFDDPGFNPNGSEGTFMLALAEDGSWAVHPEYLPPGEQLLAETPDPGLFGTPDGTADAVDAETFFIDPSVLAQGENEIVLDDFQLGIDTLALSDELSVKDVVVDSVRDMTEIILERHGQPDGDDIVVRLLGVDPADVGPEAALDLAAPDDLDSAVQHIIDSGGNDLT